MYLKLFQNISYSIQEIFEDSDSIDIDELLNFRREGDSVLYAMARKEFNEYVWKIRNYHKHSWIWPILTGRLLGSFDTLKPKQISKCVKFLVSHKNQFINDVMDKIDTIKPGTFDKILKNTIVVYSNTHYAIIILITWRC